MVITLALTVPLGISPAKILGQPVFLFDAPLVLLYVVGGWALYVVVKSTGGLGPVTVLPAVILVFLTLCVLAFAVHPSSAGVVLLVRLGAGGILAWAVRGLSRRLFTYAAAALVLSAAVQSVIAVAQYVHRGPIGVSWLGEGSAPLNRLGQLFVPRGTFNHQYPLAAFCLLAATVGALVAGRSRRQWPWLVGTVAAVAPLGITFSRQAVLGLVLVLACLCWAAWRHDRNYLPVVICLALGLMVPAALAQRGWTGRVYQTTHSPTVNALSSGRVRMYQSSLAVVRANPAIGVGPGREAETRYPVNDVFLLIAEEDGIVAALVAAGVVVLLARRALGTSPLALGAFLALTPFLIFDYFLYGIPQGPVMAGLWAGASCSPLALACRRRPTLLFRPSSRV